MASKSDKGLHDSEPVKNVVDEGAYPARPYHEAVSDEHKKYLAERELKVSNKTEEDPTLTG